MSELKAHTHIDYILHDLVNMKFYIKSEVDALIAKKDEEITRLESACRAFATERDANQDAIYELRKEIESLKATHYAEMVDAGMRERRLRRALYKACANWAKSERYTEATWHGDEHREELWAEVQDKCLKKAEEYK